MKGPGMSHMVSNALVMCPGGSSHADSMGSRVVPAARPGSPHLPFLWSVGLLLVPPLLSEK